MTTCDYYVCQREEQCDSCFMVDHQKECGWCEEYDHDERKLEVSHGTETHYEVVWKDGKSMTKVEQNILLK